MREDVFIPGQGMFVKSDSYDEVVNELIKQPLKIGRTTLISGERFDLDGYFNIASPVYVGYEISKRGGSECMLFYNGYDDSTLFSNAHYFEMIYRITKDRIFCLLSERGGRDYNFINGIWDWERKRNSMKDYGKRHRQLIEELED